MKPGLMEDLSFMIAAQFGFSHYDSLPCSIAKFKTDYRKFVLSKIYA